MELIKFFIIYNLILFSIIGYGNFFQNITFKKSEKNLGLIGIFGIFFLITYSYISHFFLSHNELHNLIILFIGLVLSFKTLYLLNKKELIIFYLNFSVLFIGLIIFKTHDDFPYYHFPYSYYLTQNPLIIGIGQLNHGFRTPSSIFYLNSLYYLPLLKYYTFYIPTLLVLGFSNLIFFNLVSKYKNLKKDYIYFLSLLFVIFFNIFFYRIQEHGTDRSAQILISVFFIYLFIFIQFNHDYKNFYKIILILLGLIVSLKAFYVLYFIFIIPIIWILVLEKKIVFLKNIFKDKITYIFLIFLILIFLTYFFNTGCFIYPVSFTCLDYLDWSIGSESTKRLQIHYELWSKAGKTPNFVIDNPNLYLNKFNWLPNWLDSYFFNKVSGFILGIIFLSLIIVCFFYTKKKKIYLNQKNHFKNILIIYIFIILLTLEWFFNHPSLRYGGYILITLLIFVPLSLFLEKFNLSHKESKKRITLLICLTALIFLSRNINRINDEINKYNYDPISNPKYRLDKQHFRIQEKLNAMIENFIICKSNELICDKDKSKKVKELYNNKYILIK